MKLASVLLDSQYCLKKLHKMYIGDVRCDTGKIFDCPYYFVTVVSSNTGRLRLLGHYPGMYVCGNFVGLSCPRAIQVSEILLMLML